MWDQNLHGEVKETDQDERISEQKIISLRNWGKCVDTVFLARVNLLGKRPMKDGPALDQRGRRGKMGLWARRRHRSR